MPCCQDLHCSDTSYVWIEQEKLLKGRGPSESISCSSASDNCQRAARSHASLVRGIYVCVYIYIFIHLFDVCEYIYIYIYIYLFIYLFIICIETSQICTCTRHELYVRECIIGMYTVYVKGVYIYIHIYTHIYIYISIYIYIFMYVFKTRDREKERERRREQELAASACLHICRSCR